MPTIVSIEDLMGTREKGCVFALCPLSSRVEANTSGALCGFWLTDT